MWGVQNTLKSSETWVRFSLFPILLDPSTTKTSLSCRLYDCDPLPWASDDGREQQKDPKYRVKGSGCPEPAAATTVFLKLTSWELPREGNFVPRTHLSSMVFPNWLPILLSFLHSIQIRPWANIPPLLIRGHFLTCWSCIHIHLSLSFPHYLPVYSSRCLELLEVWTLIFRMERVKGYFIQHDLKCHPIYLYLERSALLAPYRTRHSLRPSVSCLT